jgi:hypothetical protein
MTTVRSTTREATEEERGVEDVKRLEQQLGQVTGSDGSRKTRGAEWEREENGVTYGVLGPTVV